MGCLYFRGKKIAKELLPLLSHPHINQFQTRGWEWGRGRNLILSKINKKKLAQDVEETKKLQERKGKKERKDEERIGSDWKNR